MFTRFLVIVLALSLGACSAVGLMADSPKQYATTLTISLKRVPQNFVESVSQVGTSLGYQVTETDPTKNAVQLSDDEGYAMGMLIGKIRQAKVMLTLQPGGHQIKVELLLYGNFDQATQTAAEGRVARLKSALASRFD